MCVCFHVCVFGRIDTARFFFDFLYIGLSATALAFLSLVSVTLNAFV